MVVVQRRCKCVCCCFSGHTCCPSPPPTFSTRSAAPCRFGMSCDLLPPAVPCLSGRAQDTTLTFSLPGTVGGGLDAAARGGDRHYKNKHHDPRPVKVNATDIIAFLKRRVREVCEWHCAGHPKARGWPACADTAQRRSHEADARAAHVRTHAPQSRAALAHAQPTGACG